MNDEARARVLVAGLGNVFLGDDGFGPAVVSALGERRLPEGVDAVDYGIASLHLAYRLAEGRHASVILVDAISTGDAPGTLTVLEITGPSPEGAPLDGHSVSPSSVLASLQALGATPPRTVVLGCEPETFEPNMALSMSVTRAIEPAVELVFELATLEVAITGASREVGGMA